MLLDFMIKDCFSQWRSTNIAQANKKNFHTQN
jgi:hypothetical protein